MNFFYKPAPGVVGDAIPYYFDGRYHVFYLRDYRDAESYGAGYGWSHVSTIDFVNFEDHGEALSKGGADEQDLHVATGAVFTDDSGKHHIFYTGINPGFRNASRRHQAILHATSDDLVTWTKIREEVLYADESIYERHDWRDPFVFKHPDSGRYTMLVTARARHGSAFRRGCTGLLTSDDLGHWQVEEPFYAPGRYYGHECPDLFQLGEWYYLVFSEYTRPGVTGGLTRYVMSRSIDGPWVAPSDNQFDNRAFYAAKTAGSGTRRFVFGWNPTKSGSADDGEWEWGGCLSVHEVRQNDDGTLSVRMPTEAHSAFGDPMPVRLEVGDSDWKAQGGSYRGESPYAYSAAFGQTMPSTYVLEGELTFDRGAGEAGVLLGVDSEADAGYFLRFNPDRRALQFGKVGGSRPSHVDHMPELDRPLEIRAGTPLRFRIVVDKSAIVAYVDDRTALSGRMYTAALGRSGVFADGTVVSVTGFAFRSILESRNSRK
jgi:beta-fructofuranosidase